METALAEIRQAEKDAERMIDEANQKKVAILAQARARVAELAKESEAERVKKRAQLQEKQQEKVAASREKLLAEGAENLKAIQRAGEKKIGDAVALVLDAVEKELLK